MGARLDEITPTALVTGGSRGIGRAIALALASSGFQIVLTYVSRPEMAAETMEIIKSQGGNASAFALDVANTAAVKALFDSEIKDKLNLSVLVNNAGITSDSLILRMKDEAFEKVLDVNLVGAFACSREAAKLMSKKRYGRIINISSVVGQMGNPGQANYSAAKAGLIGLTKTCAKELAPRQITVNAIAPGFIETEMTEELDAKTKAFYIEAIPLKRYGTVEEVGNLAAFLASDKAAYITGQVIGINGGLYC